MGSLRIASGYHEGAMSHNASLVAQKPPSITPLYPIAAPYVMLTKYRCQV